MKEQTRARARVLHLNHQCEIQVKAARCNTICWKSGVCNKQAWVQVQFKSLYFFTVVHECGTCGCFKEFLMIWFPRVSFDIAVHRGLARSKGGK